MKEDRQGFSSGRGRDRSRRIFSTPIMVTAIYRPVVLWKRIDRGSLVEGEGQVP